MAGQSHIGTTASKPLDRDRLLSVSRRQAAAAAHLTLFQVQDEAPEVIVAGAAVWFAAVCARCGLDPQEIHGLGMKILRPSPLDLRTNDSLQSLRDFAGLRVKGNRGEVIS